MSVTFFSLLTASAKNRLFLPLRRTFSNLAACHRRERLRSSLRALSVFPFILILLTFAAITAVFHAGEKRFTAATAIQERQLFSALIDQSSAPLRTFVDDYGYWDDLVAFIQKPAARWSAANIDTCLEKFDADAIWIFRADGTPVYTVKDDIAPAAAPATAGQLAALFSRDTFCHYFIATKAGIMEIRGATVHPTSDYARSTVPRGYLLAGRLWTPEYLAGLSKSWGQPIVTAPAARATERFAAHNGNAAFTYTLCDAAQSPVVQLRTEADIPLLREAAQFSAIQFIIALILLAVVTLAFIHLPRPAELPPAVVVDGRDAGHDGKYGDNATDGEPGIVSDFLQMRSRVIKRADQISIDVKKLRLERFEMENRIKQRMAELFQSFRPAPQDGDAAPAPVRMQNRRRRRGAEHTSLLYRSGLNEFAKRKNARNRLFASPLPAEGINLLREGDARYSDNTRTLES